jgi:acyl transferase domain-containing protein
MCSLFSKEGKSYAFDGRGEGFGRGEGVGCVILKPLDEAIKANDSIRAVIVGTGINQDGKTKGITMPSGDAQVSLMRSVYEKFGLDPKETGYVEAHGTGTATGDPIEATALHNMFSGGRSSKQPLYIGSVKTNVGHLEGASGIVSVIKTAMMLEKGFLLPNCNFEKGNPKIPFEDWNLKVCQVLKIYRPLLIITDIDISAALAPRQKVCQCQQFWIWRYKCTYSVGARPSSSQASYI